ncbi:MAG: hypothetical protein IPL92_01515 [Saprospiraceae bacterium]|nr:hypothetical protein [Candidatus Opimibacter iunctus]
MINLRNSPFLWLALLLLLAISTGELKALDPEALPTILLWGICIICCILSVLRFKPGRQIRSTLAISLLMVTAGLIRVNEFRTTLFPGTKMPPRLSGCKVSSSSPRCSRIKAHQFH